MGSDGVPAELISQPVLSLATGEEHRLDRHWAPSVALSGLGKWVPAARRRLGSLVSWLLRGSTESEDLGVSL